MLIKTIISMILKNTDWLLVYVRGNQTNNNTLSEETNAHTHEE